LLRRKTTPQQVQPLCKPQRQAEHQGCNAIAATDYHIEQLTRMAPTIQEVRRLAHRDIQSLLMEANSYTSPLKMYASTKRYSRTSKTSTPPCSQSYATLSQPTAILQWKLHNRTYTMDVRSTPVKSFSVQTMVLACGAICAG